MYAAPGPAKLFGISILTYGIIFSAFADGANGLGPHSTSTYLKPPAVVQCAPAPTSDFVVNVKDPMFGAVGDGLTNDTFAIQKAVNAVADSGGTVLVPAGNYLVNPVANSNAGIRLRNNMTMRFEAGAVLQALPTSTSNYVILMVSGAQNVNILGGTIRGNRFNNTIRDTREGGDGIHVARSRHVFIQGVTSMDCWEDGFYIGEKAQDVTLCNVTANGNRRQGLSITSVDGLVVKGSTFKNTTGFMENGAFVCGSGTDIEPNRGQTVRNVQFLGCTFSSNATEGIAVGPSVANRGRAFVENVVIDGNAMIGNGLHHGAPGITISNTSGHRVVNNKVKDNVGFGICLRNEANDNIVKGNLVTNTKAALKNDGIGYGILLYKTAGNSVIGNTVSDNAACGIRDASPSGINTINSNRLKNNHPDTCP
ncbi:right-handed parallel beta-helix repeat-containing protein [Geothrix campi]|uniref:right-handed parallel beta-helix repeat-containing protein n=1 Tax=Geothrix campi TaxID=2966450 RepID=UPI0021498DB0|nr:right-handed parallel beta-helix repeat-containing protein [Geothrix sp. SG10]